VQRKVEAARKDGGKAERIDIFAQRRTTDDAREAISPLEKKTTVKIVLENMGAKSGRDTLYWYGTLDSFHDSYRNEFFPNIYKQMVAEAGTISNLLYALHGTEWATANAEAYVCGGNCGSTCHHFYKPRNWKTVQKILKEEGVKFRCITKTVPCRWHDNWERWKSELRREQAKPEGKQNLKQIQRLKAKLVRCQRHDDQYQAQRRYNF
jgi:hypothetical protein